MVGTEVVAVGSWVLIRDGEEEEAWRITEPAEADVARHRISTETPMARALLGRRAGDQVRVWGPERRQVAILRVWAEDADVQVEE